MNHWKVLFPEEMLGQGQQLNQRGRVKYLYPTANGFEGYVDDDTPPAQDGKESTGHRKVLFDVDGNELTEMWCSCHTATVSGICRHMAAVLFAVGEAFGNLQTEMDPYHDSQAAAAVGSTPGMNAAGTPAGSKGTAGSGASNTAGDTPGAVKGTAVTSNAAGVSQTGADGREAASSQSDAASVLLPGQSLTDEIDTSALSPKLQTLVDLQQRERRKISADSDRTEWQPQEYRYFHYELYRSQLSCDRVIQKNAEKMIREGHAAMHFDLGYTNHMEMGQVGEAVGNFNGGIHANILISADRILRVSCSSWGCMRKGLNDSSYYYSYRTNEKYNICEHVLATYLLLEDYLKENNPGDNTEEEADLLIRAYAPDEENDSARSQTKSSERVTLKLAPQLTLKDGMLSACFKVGTGRLYKIKNIVDFVYSGETRSEMSFASGTVFAIAPEKFDDSSRAWFDFLLDTVREEERRQEYMGEREYYRGMNPLESDTLGLYGSVLDRFFNLAMPGQVDYVNKDASDSRRTHKIGFADAPADIVLRLKKQADPENGMFTGVRLQGSIPEILLGAEYGYYIDEQNDRLCRFDGQKARDMIPLMNAAPGGEIDLGIGRKQMTDFYRKTLPQLRNLVSIEETDTDEIARYLPPDPEIICYLDVDEDRIVCRADSVYGSRVHSLFTIFDWEKGTYKLEPWRDIQAEGAVISVLTRYLRVFDAQQQILYMKKDDAVLFEFLDHGLQELLAAAQVQTTEAFRRLRLKNAPKFNVGISVESSLMELTVTSDDLSPEELADILFHYRRKKRFVRLKSGEFLKLDDVEALEELARMMEELHLSPKEFTSGKMHLPVYRALYLDKMLERNQEIYATRDRRFKELIKEFKTVEDAEFELPASLKGVLRNYQKTGYRWLRTLARYGFGGVLADEMGLGKTLQVIAVLLSYKEEAVRDPYLPSLVVCPASLVYNWEEELHRFAPSLRVTLIAGTVSARKRLIAGAEKTDVLVTSYDLLKRDIAEYEGHAFAFQILDEAQYIKNQQTAAAKAVKLVNSRIRFALTGTPIENRLSELWSIFDYLMPGFLYDYQTFRSDLESAIVQFSDDEAAERLRRLVSPFILRRRKTEVLTDLPEKLEETRYARMEPDQQHLYDAQVVRMKKEVAGQSDEQLRKSQIQILAELTRIRQICCDPSLFLEDYHGGSAKREACMDLIRSVCEGEHKALIFSQFTSMLELLEEDLKREGIAYYKITGATPKQQRIGLVKSFNEDQTPVFLISLKAGGTGLNLTGADVVIHYDPWWNLAVQDQATDRAHRIGQTKVVTVYRLIVKDTIEERIVKMQETKRELAEDIIGGEAVSSAALRREDLLALLG